jgi:hypothetical protein
VLAHICHVPAVRRELGISAGIGRRSKLHRRLRPQVVQPELSLRIENQMLRIRRPQISRHVIPRPPLLLALVLHDLIQVRIKGRQFRRADQHLLLAGGGIDIPQLALLPLFVALHEREPGAVRTPLESLGPASRQSSRLVHRFNRERLARRSLRPRRIRLEHTEDCEQGNARDERNLPFQEVTSQVRNNSEFSTGERRVYTAPASACTGTEFSSSLPP